MGLATVIRLEFAYPGVGVLAGDSLQYLSIATAHGVIMVFFMIMPSLFGAFGNFLLPTQLGVHDVAFPRLNSAAFWFLPGGLIMLVHLVCIDRRYQRMNCFSIRELQSMLKQKFFADLVHSNDHHTLLNNALIGLRYKMNMSDSIDSDITSFYKFGTTSASSNKDTSFLNNYSYFKDQFSFSSTTPMGSTFFNSLGLITASFSNKLASYFSVTSLFETLQINTVWFFRNSSVDSLFALYATPYYAQLMVPFNLR